MGSEIKDEERYTKYFLFTLMAEKKLASYYQSDAPYYVIGSVIGKSSFGSSFIYAGQYIKTTELVAVRKYNLERLSVNEIKLIQFEINIMNQIMNRFILSSLVSFVSGSEIISVLPLSNYGSCCNLIKNHFHGGLPEIIINLILKDVIKALRFIHSKGIIHRAIKASHILISSDGHSKLTGFRYAYKKLTASNLINRMERIYEFPPYSVSNLKWLSPDILQQNLNGYNEKSDIYSLGITVCELANGIVPFKNCPLKLMIIEKMKGNIPKIFDFSTVGKLCDIIDEEIAPLKDCYLNRKFSKNLHGFKNQCCILNPEQRPDARVLMMHPLFSRVGKQRRLFSEHIFPAVPITEKNFLMFNSNLKVSPVEIDYNPMETNFNWEF